MDGWSEVKNIKSKMFKAAQFETAEIEGLKMVAFEPHGTGSIWCSCFMFASFLRVAEHGSILCIQILIAGETHVAPTKFCRQSDADVSGWQPACIRLF